MEENGPFDAFEGILGIINYYDRIGDPQAYLGFTSNEVLIDRNIKSRTLLGLKGDGMILELGSEAIIDTDGNSTVRHATLSYEPIQK